MVIELTLRGLSFSDTRTLSDLKGKRVLSKGGTIVGRVCDVRIHPRTFALEGIVVRRALFGKRFYFSTSYIAGLRNQAVFLTIEPAPLAIGKVVVAADGYILGTVRAVHRVGSTNEIESLRVKSPLTRTITIPARAVNYIGARVILKAHYHAPPLYFWHAPQRHHHLRRHSG